MRRFWMLILLILLAFGLRAGSLTAQSLWRDEVDALCYAHEFPHLLWEALAPGRAGDLRTPCACPPPPIATDWTAGIFRERAVGLLGAMIRQNGPLYYFTLRGWVALAGHTEYALRFFSLLFGILCVPLTAALGTRLLSRTAAVFAAALMAASPYMVWYGQEVKMYTLLPALVLLALYSLRRGMDEGGNWWTVQIVATTLLLYTHIWGALLIPLQILWLVLEWPRWRPRWRGALAGIALLTLPYLPLALWQMPAVPAQRETGFPHHTLVEMALILLNGWSTGILSLGWPWGALACGGMAALGLTLGLARPALRRAALFLALWMVFPLLIIWLISLRQPLFTDRYLIWAAPAFYLLVGAGWSFWGIPTPSSSLAPPPEVQRLRLIGKLLPTLAIPVVFALNLHAQATVPIKSDIRAAAAYVESRYQPGDLLLFQIPHIRYTFDYYFGPTDYLWADGLYTNHRNAEGKYRLSEEAAGRWMALIVGDRTGVWLVASEVEMWDERNLVQGWMERTFTRADEAHFTRVDVYKYQR
ncbi:MAG: glycosyltransferase family 39 protein [Anaerolineae bacterium]